VDFFRTMAGLAGAEMSPAADQQVEGRSLLPLLENPSAPWEDRLLFTHVGRWQKFSDPDAAKYRNCAVRNTQYTLVSEGPRGPKAGSSEPKWQLFDVKTDPGQNKDISAEKPDIVEKLRAAYDGWWSSLKGQYDVNENVLGPKLNPFAERYWKQFGGGPTPEDYERMDPEKARTFETQRGKGKGKNPE
jgi:arylsulfatase